MVSRTPRGEGTIYLRKDGRFEGAVYLATASGAAKRVRVYGSTRKEAYDKLVARIAQANRGVPTPDKTWSVATYLDHWMSNVVPTKTRPRTVELYESTVRLHIKPLLGRKRLIALSAIDVQQAVNSLLRDGHSSRTVHKMRTVLSSALGRAEREELIFRNVARLVELPAYQRKDIRPWNTDEAKRFLEAIHGHAWEAGYLLLVLYGMRRGEVLGLRWGDIDFGSNRFHIRQQIQRIGGRLSPGPVKTDAGQRTLPLLPTVREFLLLHARATGVHLEMDADPTTARYADRLVLTSQTGHPVEPGNFSRAFQRIVCTAGLPRITVHHTRHTAATLLKSLGVPARDAQLILGHSSVTTTQMLYQHGDIDAQRTAMESVERALIGRSQQPNETTPDVSVSVLNAGADGRVSRQRKPSLPELEHFSTGQSTEIDAFTSGGPAGDRTLDILLKRTIQTLSETLPTSVIRALHTRTNMHIVGRVAVKLSRQTVPSTVASDPILTAMLAERRLYTQAVEETRHPRPFPLLPTVTTDSANRRETRR